MASSPQTSRIHKVALLGFGSVGSAVARVLCDSHPAALELTHICNRNIARKKTDALPASIRWTEDFDEVLASDADIVVEVIGGLAPAEDWVRRSLAAGKSVVTANKQLIARRGDELLPLAHELGRHLLFGAAVAGGIPVISGLQQGLAGDELFKIHGILNGTCNFILSHIEHGASFAESLAEAQRLGFAEADPTDDVDGFDAAAKLAILARVGLRSAVQFSEIACRSIRPIQAVDFEYAHEMGCTIRQISRAERVDDVLLASVEPGLVPLSSPLAQLEGGQNMVLATGRYGGDTVFAGHGAGGNPTAVAILSDVLSIVANPTPAVPGPPPVRRAANGNFTSRYALRLIVDDRPGIIVEVASILAARGMSIDAVLQKPGFAKNALPFMITLEPCRHTDVEAALEQIEKLPFVTQPALVMPLLDL